MLSKASENAPAGKNIEYEPGVIVVVLSSVLLLLDLFSNVGKNVRIHANVEYFNKDIGESPVIT